MNEIKKSQLIKTTLEEIETNKSLIYSCTSEIEMDILSKKVDYFEDILIVLQSIKIRQ